MLGLFKSKPQIKGRIGYFGLADWWLADFTDLERRRIRERFQPLGSSGDSLTEGDITHASETAVAFLAALAGWFQKPEDRQIAYKVLEKARSLVNERTPALDVHFLYAGQIEICYRDREKPGGLEKAAEACRSQIAYAPQAARAFKKKHGGPLPGHKGFEQLAIILEKQSNYAEAVDLCKEAKSKGWAGDWQKRIDRCRKKLKQE